MIISREGFTVSITFDQPWEQETLAWILQTYGPNYLRKHLLKLLAQKQEARKFIQIKQELDDDGGNSGASPAVAWAKRTSDSGIGDNASGVSHSEPKASGVEPGSRNSGQSGREVSEGSRTGD